MLVEKKCCETQEDLGLAERIKELKKARNAIILVHNYQRPEIQDIGDLLGDSLGLCRAAAASDAEVICFCGVRFMAESAAIICPDKRVVLPSPEAGCSLADDLNMEDLRRLKKEHPRAAVVCYVNSTAQTKAESDICCTSANAVQVVNALKEYEEVIFIPDRNLGHYVSLHTEKRVHLTNVYCTVHNAVTSEEAVEAKAQHPDARFIAHPECKPEVLELADFISSTAGMAKYVKESGAKEFIVGTEIGMIYRLQKDFPGYKFHKLSDKILCNDMKLVTLERLARSLETLEPIVTVPEDIRKKAEKTLNRMMEIV